MTDSIYLFFQIQLLLLLSILFIFFVYLVYEHEKTAAKKAFILFLLVFLVFVMHSFNLIPFFLQLTFSVIFTFITFLIFLPFGNKPVLFEIPHKQFDERDIMFSRMELKKETEKFDQYYQMRPENKLKDDLFRQEPGLLNRNSKLYSPFLFRAAEASFSTINLLQPLVEKTVPPKVSEKYSENEITAFIKNWTVKLGAESIGFTLLKPHHIYSHIGRGKNYGKKVELNHKFAIAFTVEMSHDSLSHSPQGPVIAESAQQYLNAGTIAIQLAEFIRSLGFDARAHIDANYRVICPAVALDAGLGTIGRMGLLMTPKHGPRVRIGVVTTDMKMEINQNPINSSIIHFCEICKKCAVNCPSNSISFESSKKEKKNKRWTIDHESCFTYWTKVGTDCGRCIAVCPYAHNNNLVHNLVRYFLQINSFNRWAALKLDNYFYWIKPPIIPLKSWMAPEIV